MIMQQQQLDKANGNRQSKQAATETRRNVNVSQNLTELQASISSEGDRGGRYGYYNDRRLIDKLEQYHKTIAAQIKTQVSEIIDDHIILLDEEFQSY